MGMTWSEEARIFFAQAENDSVNLYFVVSYDCASQTRGRFLAFVKALQQEHIRQKIRKIFIIDTAYLQRFRDKSFARYADVSLVTPWQQENSAALEELSKSIPCEILSWATFVKSRDFDTYRQRIKLDFAGDKMGREKDDKFRSIVLSLASQNTHKYPLRECCDYIIEESAQIFLLRDTVIAHQMRFNAAIKYVIGKYSLNVSHLSFSISNPSPTEHANAASAHVAKKIHEIPPHIAVQQMALSDAGEGNIAIVIFIGTETKVSAAASQFLQNITMLGLFGKGQQSIEGDQPYEQAPQASTAPSSSTTQ